MAAAAEEPPSAFPLSGGGAGWEREGGPPGLPAFPRGGSGASPTGCEAGRVADGSGRGGGPGDGRTDGQPDGRRGSPGGGPGWPLLSPFGWAATVTAHHGSPAAGPREQGARLRDPPGRCCRGRAGREEDDDGHTRSPRPFASRGAGRQLPEGFSPPAESLGLVSRAGRVPGSHLGPGAAGDGGSLARREGGVPRRRVRGGGVWFAVSVTSALRGEP